MLLLHQSRFHCDKTRANQCTLDLITEAQWLITLGMICDHFHGGGKKTKYWKVTWKMGKRKNLTNEHENDSVLCCEQWRERFSLDSGWKWRSGWKGQCCMISEPHTHALFYNSHKLAARTMSLHQLVQSILKVQEDGNGMDERNE